MGVAIQEGSGSTYYIYVSDTENGRVQKFSNGGAFLGQFGHSCSEWRDRLLLSRTGSSSTTSAASMSRKHGFGRVYKFPSSSVVNTQTVIDGTPTIEIYDWASGTDSLGNAQGVAVDDDGAIFIADTATTVSSSASRTATT